SEDTWLIGGTQDNGTLGNPHNTPRDGTWDQIAPGDGGDCGADDTDVERIVAKAGVTLWVSDDSGDSWEEVDFGGQAGEKASAVSIVSGKTIFLGTEKGRLVRIDRASSGWANGNVTQLTSPRSKFVSDMVVVGASKQVIWTGCSAFGGGHVFR